MSLFADIMNIQTPPEIENVPYDARLSCKALVRNIIDEAAELALTYDNLVDTLEESLEGIRSYIGSGVAKEEVEELLETIQKVRSGEYK